MQHENVFKNLIYIFLGLIFVSSHAQEKLNIDTELRANSIPIHIKRKGISAIGKYEFHNYKLVSGKVGWTTTKDNTSLKANSKISSSNKKSFVFTNAVKDSVIANMSLNSNAEVFTDSIINISVGDVVMVNAKNNFFNRTFFNWSGRTLTKGTETFLANVLFLKDNQSWNLLMISPLVVEVDGTYQTDSITEFKAALSNGNTEIEIKKIHQRDDAKTSLLRGPDLGFEFYLNNKAIAALQYHYMSMDQLYIWFHNDLNEQMKFVIATASTALLVKQY